MADLTPAAERGDIRETVRRKYAEAALAVAAGLTEVEIRPTHRVHEHAASAIIRARKPAA